MRNMDFSIGLGLWLGSIIGFLCEAPTRHIALLGYMMPKAIETIGNMLHKRLILRPRDWHSHFLALVAWVIISYATLVKRRKIKMNKKQTSPAQESNQEAEERDSPAQAEVKNQS